MKNYYPKLVGTKESHMCGCKTRHATMDLAVLEKRHIIKNDKTSNINVYQCPYCHFWHVGKHKEKP